MNMNVELVNLFIDKLGVKLDPSNIDPDQSIQDMGMDSLILIKLIYLLEEEYGVTLRTEEILNINTLSDLVTCVEEKIAIEP